MGNFSSRNSTINSRRRRFLDASAQHVSPPSQYPNPNIPPNDYITPRRHRCHFIPPQLEHERAVTVRIEVNVKRGTFTLSKDPSNSDQFVLSFTFDALTPGNITVAFFAKEGEDCKLIPTKDNGIKPIHLPFQKGIGQQFKQPSGTGIGLSELDDTELSEASEEGAYPLLVKLEGEGNSSSNCYIALAVFARENGRLVVRVVKQILWVNSVRHELHEIYGIGNAVDVGGEEDETGKECVICMAEPRDTTVLPCRHMCLCSGCAKALRLLKQYRCPICRQRVERLLEIMVADEANA